LRYRPAALAFLLAAPGAAFAQAPVAGQTVERIELVLDRSVIFEPTDDGKLHILRVIDGDRTVQLPRAPGQVAVAMSFNNEGGTLLEFNNGLAYNFDYDLKFISPEGKEVAPQFPVCTVGSDRVGVEHWPQRYPRLVIGGFRQVEGFTC
jgi:hypothetical protein